MSEIGRVTPRATPSDLGISTQQLQQLQQFFQGNTVGHSSESGEAPALSGIATLDVPALDADEAMALLQSITAKLSESNKRMAIESVNAKAVQQEKAHDERLDKLTEAAEAADKAKKSGEIGKVFAWIGVALAVIAAVATTVVTLGAGSGASALMIAGAVFAVAGATLATTSQVVNSIPGAMEGMGKEGAEAFMYTMMALQIATALGSIGTGVASVAGVGAKTAGELATQATRAQEIAQKVALSADVANGVTEVSGGANEIVAAEQTADADYLRADVAEIAKFLKQITASQENEIEFVKKLQEFQDQGWEAVLGAFRDMAEARQSVVSNSPA